MTFSSVTDIISIVPSGKIFPPPCFKLINGFQTRFFEISKKTNLELITFSVLHLIV